MKPEDYSRREQELAGWPVTIETYSLGDVYHCTIASVDPGARIRPGRRRDQGRVGVARDREGDPLSGANAQIRRLNEAAIAIAI